MKKTLAIAVLLLTSFSAFAAKSAQIYECSGLADVEEYRVGINLNTKKAAFFDNDTLSVMKLVETKIIETAPTQKVMVFEGNDESQTGSLKLVFNLNKKNVSLYSISESKGSFIGSASCELTSAEGWDELK